MNKLALILLAVTGFLAGVKPAACQEGGGVQGPIDIRANEQEFSGETVIARGNVKVTYKDSVIHSPMATLFRDPSGNPSRAIFTGHPHLSQGRNRIDAETLTFEIANSKIVAKGNAHSEVEHDVEEQESRPQDQAGAPAAGTEKTGSAASEQSGSDKTTTRTEKIITDADVQEYDQLTGRFDAMGHVRVTHGDIKVSSDKLQLVYGSNNKPETAVFSGNVTATQNKNSTEADTITYSLTTKRLQATGNVKSKVIQEKEKDRKKEKKPQPVAQGDLLLPAAVAAAPAKEVLPGDPFAGAGEDKPLFIHSDTQDYSRDNGRVSAHGHVKVIYGDTIGIGPSVLLTRTADGKPEKVVFTGRSQISQPGRRWIADTITFMVDDRRVIAQGNSKAMILKTPRPQTAPSPAPPPARLAESSRTISTTRIESPK